MKTFIAKHRDKIQGVLHCFDRVILLGHLPIAGKDYFMAWLTDKRIGMNLRELPEGWRNFKEAAPWFAERVKAHAQVMAKRAGRPYQHLPSHQKMESDARAMAERDGITQGLVCVYSTLEKCRTFRVRFTPHGPLLSPDLRVCLVLYSYWMDREFGLVHVKIQTWFPFTVQVYVNGHEYLAQTSLYDSAGHIKAQINPLGKRTSFSYAPAENLTARISPLVHLSHIGRESYP